ARAELAKSYMDSCFKLPFVVGLHWFQWPDQPILGRGNGDGERSAFGIVDVADRPHKELTEAIRESAGRMYERHGGA
ncbi:MAG: beta-agarase, partial [Verrucomicrobiota bacterium]